MEIPWNLWIDETIRILSTYGLNVVGAIALLVAGRVAAGAVRSATRRALGRVGIDASLVPFLSSLTYYLVLAIVVVAVLSLFGIETTSVVAMLGAAGLAVGLALQGTLTNVAAGVMLLIFRPFRIGDFVDAAGVAGTVTEVGLFTTTLNTADNVCIIVPNSSIYGQIIKNFSTNDTRRNDMVVGVSYDDDLNLAIDTIRSVLASDARVLAEPEALVAVAEMGDSSVNLFVRPWCKRQDYWALRFDLVQRMKTELEAAGCSIACPPPDVRVHQASADD